MLPSSADAPRAFHSASASPAANRRGAGCCPCCWCCCSWRCCCGCRGRRSQMESQRTAGTTDRRYAVGRTNHPLPAGPQRGSLRLIGSDIGGRPPAANNSAERGCAPLLRNNHEFERLIWLDAQTASCSQRAGSSCRWRRAIASRLRARPASMAREIAACRCTRNRAAARPGAPITDRLSRAAVPATSTISAAWSPPTPMARILDEMVPWWFAQDNEITLTDSDENRDRPSAAPAARAAASTPTAALSICPA